MSQYVKVSSILFGALLLVSGCSTEKAEQTVAKEKPLPVKVITVEDKNVPIWTRFTGRTKASSHQDVRARVSGVLEKIYFKDGELVKKGEKLFQIEQDQYIAALNAAKAQKLQDEASLALARADVKRYTPLVEEGLAPRATLEQYQAKLAVLKAIIQEDRARIKKAQIELSYTVIKAPISGQVSARRVDVGNLVGQGESTLLTTIVKTDPLYVYFSPAEEDARMMYKYASKDKKHVFIELNGAQKAIRLNGYLDFSNNIVDPLTSTITMRATIANPKHSVLPGSFVYVNVFVTDKHKFKMIPPEVILNDQLGKYVYIVDNNATVKRADIKTGYATRYYVSVKEGLKNGDKVIISALMKLKPGIKVIATDATKEAGIDAILEKNDLIVKKR
ncbi:MAG: efflux RND transporter periplasmic adaptor subunit [Sulfurimonas sp.]